MPPKAIDPATKEMLNTKKWKVLSYDNTSSYIQTNILGEKLKYLYQIFFFLRSWKTTFIESSKSMNNSAVENNCFVICDPDQ